MRQPQPDLSSSLPGRDEYAVWSQDMFDRETPPVFEARGRGLAAGLAALWAKHLAEGVQDDGRATFTAFHLAWRETSITIPEERAGAQRLRHWAAASSGFTDTLALLHAAAIARADAAGELLALAAVAATADDFLARARTTLGAGGLLRAAATRQQRLQWLGVGAWVVLAGLLAAAWPAVPADRTQLQLALAGGVILLLVLAAATVAETLVVRRRETSVLAALPHPELIAAVEYTVGRFRMREIHRITITLLDGTRARFVLSADGAAAVRRELGAAVPGH